MLITRTFLKGSRNYAIPRIRSVNIFEGATHPRVGTEVLVWHLRTSKRLEDIHNDAKATHISCQMLVNFLNTWYRIRANILIGIIVVHQHEIPC